MSSDFSYSYGTDGKPRTGGKLVPTGRRCASAMMPSFNLKPSLTIPEFTTQGGPLTPTPRRARRDLDVEEATYTMYRMDTERGTNKGVVAEKLKEARERTRVLLGTVAEEDLVTQHDSIMSPLIWDFGHIGNYEELWLLQRAHGKTLSKRDLYDMYDASLHPREERPSLNL